MRRYRASALDRSLAASRIVAVVGPVADLQEDVIAAKLSEAVSCSATPRIALAPSAGAQWDYRVIDWSSAVHTRPDLSGADLGALLNAVRGWAGDHPPIEVAICGDYLLVDYSHGLGDGRLGLALLSVLAGEPNVAAAQSLAKSLTPNALGHALRRQFAARPAQAVKMLSTRKLNKAAVSDTDDAASTRRISRWRHHRRTVTGYLHPRECAELRARAKSRFPESTRASITIALLMAALHAEGIRVADQVAVLVDCRRYLPAKAQDGYGNFAVAVPIVMPPNPTPTEVAQRVRTVTESGWPVAVLGLAELKAMIRRGGAPAPADPTDPVEVPDRIRLSVSDLGKLTMFDQLNWVGGSPPQVSAYIEPDGPDAVTVLVDELAGGQTLAASFCDQMVDPAVMQRALDRLCADPVAVLSTLGGAP
ncbi:hypothetical protein A5740_17265 [Mycobacterium sp. GA-1841]|nr:hypothetical protein A5740_17265 [Mycobacterium sp. GA-1841]